MNCYPLPGPVARTGVFYMSKCLLSLLVLLNAWFAFAQVSFKREPLGPSTRKTGLVISEIMYNSRVITTTNESLEFIELHNSNPWAENISGYAITGSVSYVFAPDTILPSGGFLVVARQPEYVTNHYGITNVLGPWNNAGTSRLPTTQGTVQLRNRERAVLLEVNYSDTVPWPISPDRAGHSLVLARPSFGEDDVRAWAQSDRIDGSPGRADPVTSDPLDNIVFNEWLAHTDLPLTDAFEIYNHSNIPVDLSGAWVTDDPDTNKFRIPEGTIIPPRGFLWWAADDNFVFQLLSEGERIYLVNSNQNRVIDAIDFRGQSNAVASGRSPDGGPYHYLLTTRTLGAPNSAPMRSGVIINEIMYNPMSGDLDDEYIEIYNRGNAPADLTAWEFVNGINYFFPSNMPPMPAGAYWVIARNPTNLMALYPNLTTNNCFGPYTGTLANGGERLTLTSDDYGFFDLPGGQRVLLRLAVAVNEVFYGDGGRWGNWSDASGSSLELIDPEADPHLSSNWADSDTSSESQWTAIEYNGPLAESLGAQMNDAVIIMLQGIGECLLDEVEVRVDNGPNLVANGGFENGLANWSLQGSHDFSTIENVGFAGSKSLHVRAASRGDNQSNRILSFPFASPIPSSASKVSIRAKARWLRGHAEILLRLHGSATEAFGTLALPRRLGTPAAVNSRRVTNAGPGIYEVEHAPVLPAANQPVVVTARAADLNGINAVILKYRVDPSPAYISLPMVDSGAAGDAVANDRVYSATIPAQSDGAMVAFYIEARDNSNATNTFPLDVFPPPSLTRCWPNDAVARECVVRWGEVQMPGSFATYHLWVTAANSNRWHHRDTMNNAPIDGTFIYNDSRIVYNALPLFSGSPWHRAQMTNGPAGANRVDYEMNFPEDDSLLGSTDFILNNPGNPNLTTVSDLSAIAEHTVFKIFEEMRLPHNRRRYIHWFVNGSQRSTTEQRPGNFIFEDVQQPNGDMVDQFFGGGQLFKVDDWFEFEPNGFDIHANNDADLVRRPVMIDGVSTLLPGPYRFMFRKRSIGTTSANDYSQIFALIDAASPPEDPNSATIDPVTFASVAEWEQWMRIFAIQRTVGNWDSYGWDRGKNDYLVSVNGLFQHMPWDIDYSLGLGRPANEPLFASNDPRVRAMFNTPAMARAYWRSLHELANGPFSNDRLDPFIDSRVAALVSNGVNVDLEAVQAIKDYIWERQGFLLTELASVETTFALENPLSFSSASNMILINGTAPVGVKSILLNGLVYPVTWTTVTNFSLRVIVYPGLNQFTLQGQDRFGVLIDGMLLPIDITYTGPAAEPIGAITITEVMHTPAVAGGQFIEIVNRSPLNFDLSFWRLDAVGYTFPIGSIVTSNQSIILAQNKTVFLQNYGNQPVFGIFNGSLNPAGEPVALVRFSPEGDVVIDAMRYEAALPWPAPVPGASLQVIDAAQDNSRVSNWAYGTATPGAANSVAATLPAYDPVWLNEVQTESLVGPTDTAGDSDPWIELFNSGATPINLEGYFLANTYWSNLNQWAFPPGATIAPGEYKLIWADGEIDESTASEWHTSFRLDYGGTLALVRPVGDGLQITDYLTWTDPGANISYGDFPDARPVFRSRLFHPTAGTTNLGHTVPLFINEWLARNTVGIRDPADSLLDDWIEIYNGSSQPINLGNYYVTDEADQPDKYRVPNNGQYVVPPRGYFLIWADDTPAQNAANRPDLHARFRLGGNSGYIGLIAPDGQTVIDQITYGSQTNDITQGRFSDGASQIYYTAKPTPRGPNSILGANTPPVFPFVPTQFAVPGQRFLINIRASDPEFPDQQTLTYSIDSGPSAVEVNSSGFFRWIVATNQTPGDFLVTVRVTDNGVPSRFGTVTFTMSIRASVTTTTLAPAPTLHTIVAPNGQATFTIVTTPGHTYRVLYKDDLGSSAPWLQLDRDFAAANPYASITDFITSSQRFYRVLLVE